MLRILSDLHVYDGLSRIRRLAQLDPLLEGPGQILINGDSCDTQIGATAEQVAALQAHLRAKAPEVRFLTGNHDPDISDVHEELRHDGRLWITHGDVFFPDATPWSRLRAELRRRIAAAQRRAPPGAVETLEWRFETFRNIVRDLPIRRDLRRRDWRSLLHRLTTEFGSPFRIGAILLAWRQGPRLAAQAAARHRPSATVVVFGHVHFASVVRQDHRTIINTGAFAGALRAWCVDVDGDTARVREIEHRRGAFHAGRLIEAIPLAAPTPLRLSTTP